MKALFKLRGTLPHRMAIALSLAGLGLVIGAWHLLTMGASPMLSPAILPSPWRVLTAFGDLYRDNEIIRNTCRSIGINLAGYIEAIALAIPLGFAIGLYPLFRGGFQKQVEGLRYIPLTAVTGLFIIWYGVGTDMKVHFLAFGILIYLLPVVIQRIDDVEDVFLRTVYTLGASPWQTIRTVYWPAVTTRLMDDVRVLTAISWTYIIVAENIDSTQGGIGALIWRVGQRQGRMDKVFALLLLIILIGVIQDRLFKRADRIMNPHKRSPEKQADSSSHALPIHKVIWQFFRMALWRIVMVIYWVFALNEWMGFFEQVQPFSHLFGETAWAIHTLMILLSAYELWRWRKIKLNRYGQLQTT